MSTTTDVTILLHQGPCIFVDKPAGVMTQAPPGIDSMEVRIKEYLRQREGKAGNIYLGIPHRLDRPASGAMVFARHVRAARKLSTQFEQRTVEKVYYAAIEGHPSELTGAWRDVVRKLPGRGAAEVVDGDHPEGKSAVLHYQVVDSNDRISLLRIVLETGRTHQIRIQASCRGWPIVGDGQYGSKLPFGTQFPLLRDRGIALHARRLTVQDPQGDQAISVVAPWPTAWQELDLNSFPGSAWECTAPEAPPQSSDERAGGA